MYTLLIVEDEAGQRSGLSRMIRKSFPDYTILEAADGEEAEAAMAETSVDIVITDIQMPNRNGLQLIERLAGASSGTKFIILTGYAYFEYAREALRHGVFEYVLKPYEQKSIVELLRRAERKLAEERRGPDVPAPSDRRFAAWLNRRLGPEENEAFRRRFPPDACGLVLVARWAAKGTDGPAPEDVDRLVEDAVGASGRCASYDADDADGGWRERIAIVEPTASGTVGDIYERLTERLPRLLRESGACRAIAGLGRPAVRLRDDAQRAYEEAKLASAYGFYFENGAVVRADRLRRAPLTPAPKSAEDDLAAAFVGLDKSRCFERLDRIARCLTEDGFPPPERIASEFVRLLDNLSGSVPELLNEDERRLLYREIEEELLGARDYAALVARAKSETGRMIDAVRGKHANKSESVIEKCKRYIEERYMEELSLEDIAHRFYFNPSYFSTFFKLHTGVAFSEYVMRTRLRRAKEQLVRTDLRIQDIAAQVGYKDPSYFIKQFKKEYGLTPADYKRMAAKG